MILFWTRSKKRKPSMFTLSQAIPGVPRIMEGQNPAAWMLNISSNTTEYEIGVDYAEIYRNSSLHRYTMYSTIEKL
jgi:hypothetical protein